MEATLCTHSLARPLPAPQHPPAWTLPLLGPAAGPPGLVASWGRGSRLVSLLPVLPALTSLCSWPRFPGQHQVCGSLDRVTRGSWHVFSCPLIQAFLGVLLVVQHFSLRFCKFLVKFGFENFNVVCSIVSTILLCVFKSFFFSRKSVSFSYIIW